MNSYLGRMYNQLATNKFDSFVRDNYLELDLFLEGFLQQLMNGDGAWYTYGATAQARVLHALKNLNHTGSIYG